VTGVCFIANSQRAAPYGCWDLTTGAAVANPYTDPKFGVTAGLSGDSFTFGTKVYMPYATNSVGCYDFAIGAACAGFTPPSNTQNYTVRSAGSVAPNCLVADGDGRQIKFFNAITGGGCLGVSGPTSMTVTPLTSYCGSGAAGFTGWGALSIPGLVAGKYTNSAVTLKDQNNAVITGFNGVSLAAGGTLSLASIPKMVTSITATVTVNGINDPTGVMNAQIKVSWSGAPPEMCFQTIAPPVACNDVASTVSNVVNAVTTSAAGSDAPGGNSSGSVKFTVQAAASQCSLTITKTSAVQSARPGDKVTYSIHVQNTGTQVYKFASLTDDLSDVLKDAVYNNDGASNWGPVTYAAPVLSWVSDPRGIAPATGVVITYSVTVKSPDSGDHSMKNTVVSASPGSNCPSGSVDPLCAATVPVAVSDVLWHKVDATAAKNVLTGAEWSFTPVDGAGKPTGASVAVTDCVAASAASCTGADIDPSGGLFRLTNLGPGTYQLVETRAPVGFKLNPTPIAITVATATVTLNLPDVVNKQMPVPVIPLTGGLGTDALTVAGGGLLASVLALAGWQLLRRRRTAGMPEGS